MENIRGRTAAPLAPSCLGGEALLPLYISLGMVGMRISQNPRGETVKAYKNL